LIFLNYERYRQAGKCIKVAMYQGGIVHEIEMGV